MNNRRLVAAGLVLLGLLLGDRTAFACGDKFVMLGRGGRFTRAKYPSTILVYMRAGSRIPTVEKLFHIEASLKAAGHRPQVVENEAGVRQALQSQRFDAILADVADVAELRRDVGTASGRPSIIPLLYQPTAQELDQAEKDASCLAKPSKKSRDLISVIDETMSNRRKGLATSCETP